MTKLDPHKNFPMHIQYLIKKIIFFFNQLPSKKNYFLTSVLIISCLIYSSADELLFIGVFFVPLFNVLLIRETSSLLVKGCKFLPILINVLMTWIMAHSKIKVPHLLWFRTSVYNYLWGAMTFTPVAENFGSGTVTANVLPTYVFYVSLKDSTIWPFT